jgi:hypothetical protein
MRYFDVGDKVKIKSLDWYRTNKDDYGEVCISPGFILDMAKFCGKTATIVDIHEYNHYTIDIDGENWNWSEEFFEDIKEERKNKLNKIYHEKERNSQED